jgi:hypothetical protein
MSSLKTDEFEDERGTTEVSPSKIDEFEDERGVILKN